jgi:hypothetical protein
LITPAIGDARRDVLTFPVMTQKQNTSWNWRINDVQAHVRRNDPVANTGDQSERFTLVSSTIRFDLALCLKKITAEPVAASTPGFQRSLTVKGSQLALSTCFNFCYGFKVPFAMVSFYYIYQGRNEGTFAMN